MKSTKDAAAIKALQELGLRKDPTSLPPELEDLTRQLDDCKTELGNIDPDTLRKFLIPSK